MFMGKLVFLAQSSLVVVVWGSKIGFCRIGDNKWTTFNYEHLDLKIMNITYYNGRDYAFDCAHRIRALDVYEEDPKSYVPNLIVGGSSSSFWVEQDCTGAIKGNCIYLTWDGITFHENGGGMDLGIYQLSNKTIEPLHRRIKYLPHPTILALIIESIADNSGTASIVPLGLGLGSGEVGRDGSSGASGGRDSSGGGEVGQAAQIAQTYP
ncbi:hypothetical protein Tco_0228297 [Tanacetum coccineum]